MNHLAHLLFHLTENSLNFTITQFPRWGFFVLQFLSGVLCADLAYTHFTSVTYLRYLVSFYTPVIPAILYYSEPGLYRNIVSASLMLVFQASPGAESILSLKLNFSWRAASSLSKKLWQSDSAYVQKSYWGNKTKQKNQCKILVQTIEFKINYIGWVSGFKSYE